MALRKRLRIFGRTRALEREIDEFLDHLSQCALMFKLAVRIYLIEGGNGEFEQKKQQVVDLESRADRLRRGIEVQLYSHTLIPESRGDVLGLLENLDSIVNTFEGTLWNFSIETPDIPDSLRVDFQELTEMAVMAVESLVLATRAFFRDIATVGDHMHKVMFYEKEADKVSTKLKRAIFAQDMELSKKAHLRHFAEQIDNVADRAEDVADRLAIYTIKRKI
jgi:predicted phosphate transport protein (TIGR00153 family)